MRLTLIPKAISLISGIFNASLSSSRTKQERLLELKSENDMLENSSEQVDLYQKTGWNLKCSDKDSFTFSGSLTFFKLIDLIPQKLSKEAEAKFPLSLYETSLLWR